MSARTKINAIIVQGALLIAGLIGWAGQSWTVFFLVAIVLIALAIHAGDIRPGSRKR